MIVVKYKKSRSKEKRHLDIFLQLIRVMQSLDIFSLPDISHLNFSLTKSALQIGLRWLEYFDTTFSAAEGNGKRRECNTITCVLRCERC